MSLVSLVWVLFQNFLFFISVCSVDVAHGLGEAGALHRCLKLNDSKGLDSWMVGSPAILWDKMSSSESLSLDNQKVLHVSHAVFSQISCVQRWSKGLAAKLVL